jgi:hypothetical protein
MTLNRILIASKDYNWAQYVEQVLSRTNEPREVDIVTGLRALEIRVHKGNLYELYMIDQFGGRFRAAVNHVRKTQKDPYIVRITDVYPATNAEAQELRIRVIDRFDVGDLFNQD